jgi:hypothetical protein
MKQAYLHISVLVFEKKKFIFPYISYMIVSFFAVLNAINLTYQMYENVVTLSTLTNL